MKDSLERIHLIFGRYPDGVGADRGFWSKEIKVFLKEKNIYNVICPKPPAIMLEQAKKSRFRNLQKRRAQTEGRIEILKNGFLGNPLRKKDFNIGKELLPGQSWLTIYGFWQGFPRLKIKKNSGLNRKLNF